MGARTDFLAEIGALFSVWLANPYVVAMVVPVGFFLIGAFGKKLIRDGPSGSFFAMSDWYLAPDAALANIGVGIAECIDQVAKFNPQTHHGQIRGTLVFVGFAFFLYLIVLSLHKHYEPAGVSTWKKVFWLLVVANLLAFMSMFVFLLAFKGVSNA